MPTRPHSMTADFPFSLDCPSASTSAIDAVPTTPHRSLPYRAVSQEFDVSSSAEREHRRPSYRSSTRRAIRRLSRLFHRVRDQFVAHIPWSPLGSQPSLLPPMSAPNLMVGSDDTIHETTETFPLDSDSVQALLQNAERFIVSEDFEPCFPEQLRVRKDETVEVLERCLPAKQEFVAVAVIDEDSNQPSTRRGNVPTKILMALDTDASCSTPDRPLVDVSGCSGQNGAKRTSLRRFFHNTSRDGNQTKNSSNSSTPTTRESPQSSGGRPGNSDQGQVPINHLIAANLVASSSAPPSTSLAPSSSSLGGESETVSVAVLAVGEDATTTEHLTLPGSSHIKGVSSPPEMAFQGGEPMDEPGMAEDTSITLDVGNGSDNGAAQENGSMASGDNNHHAPVCTSSSTAPRRTPTEEARYKRQFVIEELVDTERHYVTDLSLVVDGYMASLSSMELPEDLQGKDKIIFANIAQILDFHKNTFLKEIEKCLENFEAAGLAFVKYERKLHAYYVKYCQNKPKSDFLMSQEQFEQFFAETRQKLNQKRTLTDLLIKPVQRIQKYQLLMKDILKYSERAGDPMDNLRKGFDVMCVVPKACDDMMQVGRLQNFDGNLNSQGKLLFQGLLQISESSPSQPFKGKERIVFLFEQSAIIADSIPKRNEYSSPTYIFKNQIMVNKMVLENNVADEPCRFVLRSNDPNQPVAFLCQANSVEEKQQWLEKINAQLDQQKTLLAALVDPKKYQNQLANSMGSLSLSTGKKDSSGSLGGMVPSGTGSPSSALNSPKHPTPPGSGTSKSSSKLFGFGKKSSTPISNARSPTSPH